MFMPAAKGSARTPLGAKYKLKLHHPARGGGACFGCDNIHSGPICFEKAGAVSNCYQLNTNNTVFHG